ncbi:MAG: arginine decarboxylase, pyruvoyl-dependent [Candidatus Thermoplasmatota archaeon]|nr:arginine decarboxylase, pyruvoyl-dependent [Candidatus Thermoplasmatota archaeon]
MIPKKMFLTKGHGTHRHRLQSFELALRDAGIASCNLVNVSSIVPPHCELISKEEGMTMLHPGKITYCVLSKVHTKKPGKIGASVGIAIPDSANDYGYIAEYHDPEESIDQLRISVEELAILMLATTKGVTPDNKGSDTLLSDEEIISQFKDQMKTDSVADLIQHTDANCWSTVVAVAVFIE